MFLFITLFFFDKPIAERIKEFFQIVDLLLQVRSLICVLDHLAVRVQFDDDGGRADVLTLLDGLVGRQERLVLHKLEAARMVDQGITGYTCFWVVGFGEAAVDDKQ